MKKGISQKFSSQIRIFLAVLIIVMIVLNFTGYFTVRSIESYLWESTRNEVTSTSDAIIAIMGYNRLVDFFRSGRTVKYPENYKQTFGILKISLIGTKGLEPDDFEINEGIYNDLLNGRKGYSFIINKSVPEYSRIICYAPIKDSRSGLIGILRTEHSGESIAAAKKFSQMALSYQLAGTIILLISMIIFGYWLIKPINSMLASAKKIGSENNSFLDEREYLVSTFEETIAELEKKRDELTEMHLREKERADNIELLSENINRSISSGIISINMKGVVADINDHALNIFSAEKTEVIGESYKNIFSDFPSMAEIICKCIDSGEVTDKAEISGKGATGQLTVEVTTSVISNVEGRMLGILCLVNDLSEIVELRKQMALKESMASLGELSAGIAHEFRNSIGTISGFASLVKKGHGNIDENLDELLKETNLLSRIVDDFLRFAKPEKIEMEKIDISLVLSDLTATLEGCEVEQKGEFAFVSGDITLLKQAFSNLIRNAVESMESCSDKKITITGQIKEDMQEVKIIDRGMGIKEEEQQKIFIPFFSTKTNGTGLGLALVQKIILDHNGRIALLSSHEKGTVFEVELPLYSG